MIDAVDLLFVENVKDNLIQGFGGGEIAAERFLNDDAHPGFRRGRVSESGAAKLVDDVLINFGRRGKIKEAGAANIFFTVQIQEAPVYRCGSRQRWIVTCA